MFICVLFQPFCRLSMEFTYHPDSAPPGSADNWEFTVILSQEIRRNSILMTNKELFLYNSTFTYVYIEQIYVNS